ncbi:MAG: LPS assembly lipoprotein LptE [Bacteroidota bacterium]|jgi:hypothetical protein
MLALHSGCGIYSHTGASIPPEAKTFSVDYIGNVSSIVAPTLSQVLTEKLKQKFINETQLKLAQSDGDFQFSGKITNYTTAPVGIQGNQTNAVNRLTIVAEITFESRIDPKKNFTQTFTNFADFPATQNFAVAEPGLINQITDMMVTDIFNKAVINW